MIAKLILIMTTSVCAFFNPSVKLSNGKTATLTGNGPPILFSTGLYGTMPSQMYNEVIKNLKKNVTVVTIDGVSPISPRDIDDLTDSLKVDTISYVSHSSFNPKILESNKINNAVLIDPIVVPNLDVVTLLNSGLNAFDGHHVNVDYPIIVIKSEKLYESKFDLPRWQELKISSALLENEIYDGVGHPDILDDSWANFAKNTNLWGVAQGDVLSFKEWQYDSKNTIPQIRKEYREYVCQKILNLVNC